MVGSKLNMLALQFGDILQDRTGTLLLPINVGSWYGAVLSAPSHWVLVVIDTVSRCVMTMDSYSGQNYRKELGLIRKRAQLVCSNIWSMGPKWRVKVMSTGMQVDGHSCGLAVAASAHAYVSTASGSTWLRACSATWSHLRLAAQEHMSTRSQGHPGHPITIVPLTTCPFKDALDEYRDNRSIPSNVPEAPPKVLPKVLPGGVPPKADPPAFAEPPTLLEWDITPVVVARTSHPHYEIERGTNKLAESIRKYPTMPSDEANPSCGEQWPRCHCAFKGCNFTCEDEDMLMSHVTQAHSPIFEAEVGKPTGYDTRWWGLYTQAVASIERGKVPTTRLSFERRAHFEFDTAYCDKDMQSVVCFCCGCVKVAEPPNKIYGEAHWQKALGLAPDKAGQMQPTFMGMSLDDTAKIMGMDTYLQNHGDRDGRPNLNSVTQEFTDWKLSIPFGEEEIDVMCCPEDRRCESCCSDSG